MKYSKNDIENARKVLEGFRGKPIYGKLNSVSRSGMSRRFDFYAVNNDGDIRRIGKYIAIIADYPYNIDKGGIKADGGGMDMLYSVLSDFNYAICELEHPDKSWDDLYKEFGRIYDKYFFDAQYRTL